MIWAVTLVSKRILCPFMYRSIKGPGPNGNPTVNSDDDQSRVYDDVARDKGGKNYGSSSLGWEGDLFKLFFI